MAYLGMSILSRLSASEQEGICSLWMLMACYMVVTTRAGALLLAAYSASLVYDCE